MMKRDSAMLMGVFGVATLCVVIPAGMAIGADEGKPYEFALKNSAGEEVGTASLYDVDGGTKIHAKVKGLAPGEHGIHVHEKALCDGPDFKTAGSHFNPAKKAHGLESKAGAHAGDMPNLKVGDDGMGEFDQVVKGLRFRKGKGSLQQLGGALVIHAKPDDQKTDPSGDSGDRIACGVIALKK